MRKWIQTVDKFIAYSYFILMLFSHTLLLFTKSPPDARFTQGGR